MSSIILSLLHQLVLPDYAMILVTTVKSFIGLALESFNIFMVVINDKLEAYLFVTATHFHPSLIFLD
jgi:hypothetical protein